MSTATLDQVLQRVQALPRLPVTTAHLIRVVGNPDSSLKEIVEAIRYDPALTAELLRLCNSVFYGLGRAVESLDDAVRLLGMTKIFYLAMAAYTRTMLGAPQEGYGLSAGALWKHSVTVALAARALAQRIRLPQVSMLFTAGLLHDCGKMVLNEFVRSAYVEIVRQVNDEQLAFSEVEQRLLGYTHAEVGARLAWEWKLPASVVECIRYHHEPDGLETPRAEVDAVHLADAVALLLGVGGGDDGLAYRASTAALDRRHLTESDLELMGAEIVGELRSVQALLAEK